MIEIGQRFQNIEVLKVDPTAKRLTVICSCRTVFDVSAQAFLEGLVSSCGCKPWPKKRLTQMKAETNAMKRQGKYFSPWRPGE